MENLKIEINIKVVNYDELNETERILVNAAKDATSRSYAPYSHFSVGAAVLLSNGKVITGSNQENAAYPSGTCAERTAIFYANAQYPLASVKMLAIAAKDQQDFTENPCPPCGSCRQVLMETEKRYGKPIQILLYSKKYIYIINSVTDILPLIFTNDFLNK
ncbi:MAG: cytidine deaminase [Phocaeicola sp.]|uniref:cytidine deaminase n=1 Tax=Phocaeicola TaxID=909656 RepID=UPI00234EB541|nr:cytidine deaminase [Phocaeicola oris]MCE2617151.1 cytidine deaminase [Phocaeicola oris]